MSSSNKGPAAQVEFAKKAQKLAEANKRSIVDRQQATLAARASKRSAPPRRPVEKSEVRGDRGDGGDSDDDDGDVRPERLLSKHQVLDRVGLSYPTVWLWMREGRFPASRDLGGRVCWLESEISEWIAALPVRRLKELEEKVA
jgi:predicted DNA-binding transcriptional regulator AlpA